MDQESGSNTTVKIVAIIGGVIIVIVASCGVLGYFGIRAMKDTVGKAMETVQAMGQDMQQSQAAADSFLSSIQSKDLQGAYQSTSDAFKKRMSRKEFDELVKKHPALKEPATNMGMDVNSPGTAVPGSPQGLPTTFKYQYHAQSKDGKDSIDFTVTVTKEGGVMKVDDITIRKGAAADQDADQP